MATTTTNFGWDIPQSTDLVKDGATAIAALGQDIDTAFVDFKGGTTGQVLKKTSGTDLDVEWGTASSGLTLINTTSFSGVSSQSFNSVFSATYENYKIICQIGSNQSDTNLNFRLRASGTDNSTASSYVLNVINGNDTSLSGARVTSNLAAIASISNTQTWSNVTFDIFKPFVATKTIWSGLNVSTYLSAYTRIITGSHNQTTSYDGFSLIPVAGTMDGTVSIYGYNA